MLPIVAILSLTLAQAERPPKLNFEKKVDYAAWINAQTKKGKSENAMDLYVGFVPRRDGKGGMTKGIPSIEGAAKEQLDAFEAIWTPSECPDLAKYIEENTKYLDLLTRAIEVRDFWDTIESGTPVMAHLLPYAGSSRWGTRALIARAWMKQPNQAAVLEDAHRVVLGARRHVQQAGFLICALVGMSEGGEVYKSVRRAVAEKVIGDKDYARWYQQLQAVDPGNPSWQFHIRMEWAMTLSAIQLVCPAGEHDLNGWKLGYELTNGNPPTPKEVALLSKSDPRETVGDTDAYYESLLAKGAGPPRGGKIAGIRQLRAELSETAQAKSNHMLIFFAPDLTRAYELLVRCESERRGTLLTLAIHAHHARHGKWPEDLGKIDAKLGLKNLKAYRVDPYTGKRFHYRVTDGKPTLYSAAADGDDDDGTHHPKFGENGEGGDYVFWPRQPK